MHGIVLKGLKDFVVDRYDEATWRTLLADADLEDRIYVPVTDYPDEEALAIVEAAADRTGEAPPDLLREFGRFLVPPLVETYGVHVDRDWDGLDLIANVETYIHEALRAKQLSTYTPPALASERLDDGRVRVTYSSDRQLCDLAKGLIDGVGELHGQPFRIEEEACMHDGADRCELVVAAAPGGGD